jgi:hypothetical protein
MLLLSSSVYVCVCVLIVSCGQTVRRMNMGFGAKDVPFIGTTGTKTPFEKIQPSSPYIGGEKGSGYGKMRKEGANIRISRPMWQIS